MTLEIVKALIEACQRDLNLFSKYVVKIIDMMSVTNDIETIDLACQVVNLKEIPTHYIEWPFLYVSKVYCFCRNS